MYYRDILFNKNYLLGIIWFIIVWLTAKWSTSLIGNNLPDEYMGAVVEIGLSLFALGVIISFIVDKYKKRFAIGFFSAFIVMLFVMFLALIINNF